MNKAWTEHDPATLRDPPYAWVMVAVVFLLSGLAFGMASGLSVFIKPLSAEFGWGRGEAASGYSMLAMSSAIAGVFWGFIADRWGSRYFGIVGALCMPLALYLLSTTGALWQFNASCFLFGALGTAMVSSPLYANVGFWFRHRPGLAIGVMASGGAVGQGIVPYLAALLIEADGWRSAFTTLSIGYLIVLLPVALLVRESPSRQESRLAASPFASTGMSDFEAITWISVAVIFCCNCMSVPIVHLVPMLTDRGLPADQAASVLMTLMLCGALVRVLGGRLCDSIGALPAYMFMSAGQTLFAFAFPHIEGSISLYALAAVFGFTFSGVMSSILVCTRMMVSAGFAARAMSITSFFGWLGMGMGAFMGGVFFDWYENYTQAFAYASLMGVVNLLILSAFYTRVRNRRRFQRSFAAT
ncbi:MAG: MFS transporter [Proteobacteria bacterium]|nr:MFS transporter [Pseudomonadota bacterium]